MICAAKLCAQNAPAPKTDTAKIIQSMIQHLAVNKEKALQVFTVLQNYQGKYLHVMLDRNITADERHRQFVSLSNEKETALSALLNARQLETFKELAKNSTKPSPLIAQKRKERMEQTDSALRKKGAIQMIGHPQKNTNGKQ